MQKKLLPPHVSRPRAHRWPYRAELAFARSVPSLIMTEEHRGSQQRPAITVVMRGVVRAAARTQRKRGKAMRSMMIAAVGIVCIFAGGCASHNLLTKADASWGRSGLFQAARAERLEQAMTDKDIAALLDVAIEAKLPTAIALAKLTGGEWGKPHLATIGGEELVKWQEIAGKHSEITGVQPISPQVLDGKSSEGITIHDVRVAAARLKCELALVCLQADTRVSNWNNAAALYWTFVGLWLVPGDVVEHHTVIRAVLLDCRTGAILGTASGDCHIKRACAAAYKGIQEDKLAQEAPARALADLQKGCDNLLTELVKSAAAKRADDRPG